MGDRQSGRTRKNRFRQHKTAWQQKIAQRYPLGEMEAVERRLHHPRRIQGVQEKQPRPGGEINTIHPTTEGSRRAESSSCRPFVTLRPSAGHGRTPLPGNSRRKRALMKRGGKTWLSQGNGKKSAQGFSLQKDLDEDNAATSRQEEAKGTVKASEKTNSWGGNPGRHPYDVGRKIS